ncbi:hypothetical protein V6N11_044070 [Hibiscus sabdariffa]|uniref:Uncharacterized protein n=1 Tax=Hibiscus sabdariffa TaxID=183260 RepID=A0ABR2RE32_9ROSI
MDRCLPQATVEKIAAVKPPRSGLGPDIPDWRWYKNLNFFVCSAYKELEASVNVDSNICWSKIWKLPVPQRTTETIEHALCSCPGARQVWKATVRVEKLSTFFSLPFTDRLLQCVTDAAKIDLEMIFGPRISPFSVG